MSTVYDLYTEFVVTMKRQMKIPRTVSDGKEALDDMAVVLRFKYQVLEMETRMTYTLGIIIPFVDTFSLRFGMFFCKIVREFEARHFVRGICVKILEIIWVEILELFSNVSFGCRISVIFKSYDHVNNLIHFVL